MHEAQCALAEAASHFGRDAWKFTGCMARLDNLLMHTRHHSYAGDEDWDRIAEGKQALVDANERLVAAGIEMHTWEDQ